MSKKEFLHLDYITSALCLVSLVVLTILGVAMRYVFNNPITWLEEVQKILILWAVFFGGSVTFRTKNHVAIEIIVDALPKSIQKVFRVLIAFVVVIVLVVMIYQGSLYVLNLDRIARVTSMLKIQTKYIYAMIPISCMMMLVSFLVSESKAIFNRGEDNA